MSGTHAAISASKQRWLRLHPCCIFIPLVARRSPLLLLLRGPLLAPLLSSPLLRFSSLRHYFCLFSLLVHSSHTRRIAQLAVSTRRAAIVAVPTPLTLHATRLSPDSSRPFPSCRPLLSFPAVTVTVCLLLVYPCVRNAHHHTTSLIVTKNRQPALRGFDAGSRWPVLAQVHAVALIRAQAEFVLNVCVSVCV